MKDEDDFRNVYNPNKYRNSWAYNKKKNETKQAASQEAPQKNGTALAPTKNSTKQGLSQVYPGKSTGLEPAPKDRQYEQPP